MLLQNRLLIIGVLIFLSIYDISNATATPGGGFIKSLIAGSVGSPHSQSAATAVSANGSTIVGSSSSRWSGSNVILGEYLWSNTDSYSARHLFDLEGYHPEVRALSADGSTWVGLKHDYAYGYPDKGYSAYHSKIGVLGKLLATDYSSATDTSANGSVVVGFSGNNAFRWTKATGMVALGKLPSAYSSEANAVSADGSVVVGESGNLAFHWTKTTGMVALGKLPGTNNSSALGVSADGSVVVGYSGSLAFRWTKATGMVALGGGMASDVSADGSVIVVGESLWTQSSGLRPLADVLVDDYGLDLRGWNLYSVSGISADGHTVVGTGTLSGSAASLQLAFIARLGVYQLYVTTNGKGQVRNKAAGINCGTVCSKSYPNGTRVKLTATPAAGFVFTGWNGACTGTGNCVVDMSSDDKNVTATFAEAYQLSVTKSGQGSITSDPTGINCGTACNRYYPRGASVKLTATPAAGYTFTGWSGVCSGTGACTVAMFSDLSVTATFSK